jgi:hypothetical protein
MWLREQEKRLVIEESCERGVGSQQEEAVTAGAEKERA